MATKNTRNAKKAGGANKCSARQEPRGQCVPQAEPGNEWCWHGDSRDWHCCGSGAIGMIRRPLACWVSADGLGLRWAMMSTLVSRQLMKIRAAVLLMTLIAVPLFAALGTSPGSWFKHEQRVAEIADQQHDPRPLSSELAAPRREESANAPRAESKPAADRSPVHESDAVLRRWAQDDRAATPHVSMPKKPAAVSTQPPSQFRQIEKQLRDWGATYYVLEHWSNDGLYRFHCRMSIDELKDYNRHFEAVAYDPLDAMANVLEQVRTWRESLVPTT